MNRTLDNSKSRGMINIYSALCVILMTFAGAPIALAEQQQHQTEKPTPVTAESWAKIQPILQSDLQSLVDKQKRLPGQEEKIDVRVIYDKATNKIIVDLGGGYIPKGMKKFSERLGEALDEVSNRGHDLVDGVLAIDVVTLRFNGRTINELFPDDFPAKHTGKKLTKAAAETPPVVLNPGHGAYYNYQFNDWKYQREPSFGVQEDLVTLNYAETLNSYLLARNPAVGRVVFTRSRDSSGLYSSSPGMYTTFTLNKMAARYYLKDLYPGLGSTMWNLFPKGSEPDRLSLREYDDDVAARPLYANYINAQTLLSIHTNAADDATTRGTTVWVQPNDAPSKKLGSSVLCYMKEQIHSTPGYSDFKISDLVNESNKGENRRATMTAIIVEVAFHTNAQDAAALQDENFRQAAMRGVEKGYRLQGTPCTPFKITEIPAVSAQWKGLVIPVKYEGFPLYPLKSTTSSCTSEGDCDKTVRINYSDAGNNSTTIPNICGDRLGSPAKTFQAHTALTDGDGVVTATFDHTYTCQP
ncbi:putative membrane protein [Xanthomonas translucens pv. poae]|uniref:N-acetylmuramoyl-L-alanine amidase n=1 Tax=Xanthomonas graminis pv. poae TaxID=227946 RepID=A0A0K3A807_9XANT|nr:N-acetylmuramoyl-L-alanine amidase [Xanthomonas translucens]UKE62495.1 N-acetylmuramoyl-L-alanine amidase [Xanthomonas translucens pv. poae]CTP91615.1 putative membrane protein [Xanthomonas translucens pv. poae]